MRPYSRRSSVVLHEVILTVNRKICFGRTFLEQKAGFEPAVHYPLWIASAKLGRGS